MKLEKKSKYNFIQNANDLVKKAKYATEARSNGPFEKKPIRCTKPLKCRMQGNSFFMFGYMCKTDNIISMYYEKYIHICCCVCIRNCIY